MDPDLTEKKVVATPRSAQCRDHMLAHGRPLAALDYLQIGAAGRGLLEKIHGDELGGDSIVVRILSRLPLIAPNHINGLDAPIRRDCRGSVRLALKLLNDRSRATARLWLISAILATASR